MTGLAALGLYYYGLRRTPALLAALGELAFPVTATLVGIYVVQQLAAVDAVDRRRRHRRGRQPLPARRREIVRAPRVGGRSRRELVSRPWTCATRPEEAAFRAELRAWLDANLPEEQRGCRGGAQRFDDAFGREWSRKLYEAGYAGLTWPKEYGGAGAPYSFQAIFYEEMAARAGSGPHRRHRARHGRADDHRARHRRAEARATCQPILAAEEIWCQGFSEPDAGSDLAAARTRAERRGDVYVVNGQKVWSSFAHIADFCILVTHSDPDAPRYQGLTYLIVDMHAPGVEVRPLRQITGEAEFNEIFFTDVEVPLSRTASATRARAGRSR